MSWDEDDATSGDPERAAEPTDSDEWWVDRFVLYSARESTLWVLLFVVIAHFAAFIASVCLAALRTGHSLAVSISLLLVVGTAFGVRAEIRRKGKVAGLTWMLVATWLLSLGVAYVGDRFDLL